MDGIVREGEKTMRKIKVSCSKAAYERILYAAVNFFENGVCFLGCNYYTCPAQKDPKLTCGECLRKNIVRMEDNK